MSTGTVNWLVNAECNYFGAMGRPFVDFNRAIKNNRLYSDELLKLYSETEDSKDKQELEHEITYLHEQVGLLRRLRDTQLNNPEDKG